MTEPEVPRRWSNPEPAPPRPAPWAGPPQGSGAASAPTPGYGPATPYGPPSVPTGYGAGPMPPLRRISGLDTALLVLGGLWTVLQLVGSVAAGASQQRFDVVVRGEDPDLSVIAYDIVSLLSLPVIIATWVVGSLWLGGAYDNARALAPPRIRRRKVWVWLGWWVPIVSLWFPKTIVDDVWAVTSGQGKLARQKHTGTWWGLWVIGMVLSNRIGFVGFGEDELNMSLVRLEWLYSLILVIAFFLWVPIVRGLTAAQDELVHSRFGDRTGHGGRPGRV